ncbi:DUF305 domain-containing protein [Rhizobacter sp. LjRoot28]|uniref:DUF305 domain-containing protein n=1 Tax=Rhizobacter sp. LjRoot28 TaxID=3342309 RepID=UPI003ECCB101
MRNLMMTAVACCALATGPMVLAQGHAGSAPHAGGGGQGAGMMHDSMMSGMQKMQGMPSTGDVDRDFAAMMRVHHQQAVDMAKAELAHGKSPELKAMAQKIIKEQQKEIAELDRWLAKNK